MVLPTIYQISGGLHCGSMNACDINVGALSIDHFMFIKKKRRRRYVAICRVCTAFSAMISCETTSTPLGSIGSCFAWRPSGQIDRCPAYAHQVYHVGTICGGGGDSRGGRKGAEGAIFLQCGSSSRTMMDNLVLRPPWGYTHVRQAYNNQLLLYPRGLHR